MISQQSMAFSAAFPISTNDEHLDQEKNSQIYSKQVSLHHTDLINKVSTFHFEHEEIDKINSQIRLTIIIVALLSGNFCFGYSMPYLSMSFSTVFSQITLKGTVTQEQSFFSAILSIGSLCGAIISNFLLKYTSRKLSLIIADLCGILSVFSVIPNREIILIARFFFGISIGISTIIMPIYLLELCPKKYYAQFSVMSGFLVGGGLLFANIIGLGYLNNSLIGPESHYWQFVFAIPAIIYFLRLIILNIIYKIDSPKWLIEKKKINQAKQVITIIYKFHYIEEQLQEYLKQEKKQEESFKNIFSKQNRLTLLIGCVLVFAYTWCGIFAVFSYSSQFFESMVNGDQTLNTLFSLILGIAQFLPAFIFTLVFRKWSKRQLLLVGTVFIIFTQIIVIGLSYTDNIIATIIKFIIICVFSFLYALTLAPITWSMIPEINNSTGTYFCYVTLFAWQLLVLYIFPYMLESLNTNGVFIVFVSLTFACFIFFKFSVKETRGLSLEQINKLYGKI